MFPLTTPAAASIWNTAGMRLLSSVARLKPGVSMEKAQANLRVIWPQAAEAVNDALVKAGGKPRKLRRRRRADGEARRARRVVRRLASGRSACGADGGRRPGAADCLRQHRQPAAGARRRTAEGDRGAVGDGRQAGAAGPPTPDREPGSGSHWRSRRIRPGALERDGHRGGASRQSRSAPRAQPDAGRVFRRPDSAHQRSIRAGARPADHPRGPGAGHQGQRILLSGDLACGWARFL